MSAFNGVKVFSATMIAPRARLGEDVTKWLDAARQRPGFQLRDVVMTQSSDDAFHCVCAVVFYTEAL